ncbi:hypothetical protein CANTEDRAFT_107082 [Yamadazyma tenuis ATCC 10573]|uniref:Protein PXR1 n=1 Tax=Candida tenuis (strain ATCC 10573 / BCRC 21748 / CBS 615 / JCM 9827 / NBRC 10315 / NRRL Y-1498 / VKM Y-70) TaxID=590646 RepID=G3B5N5_CANTC|nr:uncharacterized protein CANTEDRAFT_107082 [Yamadazyma tenuis ATCC 10573]EGV63270.1 hypothetical protein CANTEDRAFT_107082 [Yamadazyma tenuis ATCC 10573]
MGLAGTKVKQRFGLDPRNTNWSNDTTRFGHQHLEKLGWKPGKGLGLVGHALTTHVKVSIKDDNLGLGAKMKKKDKELLNDDVAYGLDAFQRILGRLNGNETQVNQELERSRKEKIINGKLGIQFIKGDVLKSTWDSEMKQLKEIPEKATQEKKRKHEDHGEFQGMKIKKVKKKNSKESKQKEKKLNKDRVSKSSKSKKSKTKDNREENKSAKDRGLIIKNKKKQNQKNEDTAEMSQPVAISSRLSARSKYIKQKKASIMDPKLLNEIFMITK